MAVVVVVVLLAVGGPVADLVAGSPGTTGQPVPAATSPTGPGVHVVRPGETYWSIAAGLSEAAGDLRPLVDALSAGNGGRPLRSGDRLVLPVPGPGASPSER